MKEMGSPAQDMISRLPSIVLRILRALCRDDKSLLLLEAAHEFAQRQDVPLHRLDDLLF